MCRLCYYALNTYLFWQRTTTVSQGVIFLMETRLTVVGSSHEMHLEKAKNSQSESKKEEV